MVDALIGELESFQVYYQNAAKVLQVEKCTHLEVKEKLHMQELGWICSEALRHGRYQPQDVVDIDPKFVSHK